MMQQLSLFESETRLAGLVAAVKAAMNVAVGANEEGRDKLLDRINSLASRAGVRLTQGNTKTISRDTFEKWLASSDREHTPSLIAVAVFCKATGDAGALRAMADMLGLCVISPEDMKILDYGRAVLTEKRVRKQKKRLEEEL